ncbi:response regulator [Candidatus Bipolaricaulota bacterium]|nr:response regulator [Candidatus Bipolaricaulota bacterium]
MLDRAKRVLIAEDVPEDVEPLVRAFRNKPAWEIAVVKDGQEALDFVLRKYEYADAWRPDLFILNINMPKIDGLDVLKQIKAVPYLATIPIVMWTISQHITDIQKAYESGAAAFVSKPYGDDKMNECADAIRNFWDRVQFVYSV